MPADCAIANIRFELIGLRLGQASLKYRKLIFNRVKALKSNCGVQNITEAGGEFRWQSR